MSMNDMNYSINESETHNFPFLDVPQDKKLLYYSTSMGNESLKSDYSAERNGINIYMINYVVRGHGRLTVDGAEYELGPGDLTFLHLWNRSKLIFDADESEIIYFHIHGGQTADIYSAYLEKGGYVLHGVSKEFIAEKFKAFTAAIGTDGGFYAQSEIIYGMLIEILRLKRDAAQRNYPRLINEVMAHIFYRCPPPSPKQVAENFGFSQVYLERLFKRHVGESMQSFILKQKYAFACRFLADSDMSVDEIARKVGYEDSKGLIVLFKKFGTLTPLAYRKKARE